MAPSPAASAGARGRSALEASAGGDHPLAPDLIERRAMPSEQINQPAEPDRARQTVAPLARWGRPLAIATAVVFCISSAFPLVAGFVTDTEAWPGWWGVLDVAVAFVLAILALIVIGLAQGKVTKRAEDASYRAYRVLIHGIFVLLVVFILLGDRIVWSNCLPGFGWRAWLLFYGLPAWLTVFGAPAVLDASPGK
jgi:VIT1/CCC1 family predicted Fe2+/Mn2+ transporter